MIRKQSFEILINKHNPRKRYFSTDIEYMKYLAAKTRNLFLFNLVLWPTSLYASFFFFTPAASSLSSDTQTPGMSSSHIVSVSVNVRSTIFSRSSSFKSSFTSSRLCLISGNIQGILSVIYEQKLQRWTRHLKSFIVRKKSN